MRTYNDVKLEEIPVEATLKGFRTTGLLGPVFLLTPLMLLALRFPAGRQLAPAAILFLLPALANPGTRFLIPGLPFVSMSLAMVFVQWQWLGLSVLFAHAILSWPQVVDQYAAQYAWRLHGMDWHAALRRTPEEETTPPSYRGLRNQRPSGQELSRRASPSFACPRARELITTARSFRVLGPHKAIY